MAERKVINKYYPNDFDPSKIRRKVIPKNHQMEHIYTKCTACSSEITIKTDPENSDYAVESGAVRCRREVCLRADDDDVKGLKSFEFEDQALGDLKCLKSRRLNVSTDVLLECLKRSNSVEQQKVEEEDEALVKEVFGRSGCLVRRVDDRLLRKRRKLIADDHKPVVTEADSSVVKSSKRLKQGYLKMELKVIETAKSYRIGSVHRYGLYRNKILRL
ncbi:hypothetical protein QVD17_33206 [Tagetes erecta]|uniref:Uncharacterized protein n=1 Tax=Tagetes erecta TaxID=13708 RepID=A0AAD8K300_TARER|nr:hypothetical protein QVD17_33206 [Tagetes erecta]